MSQLIPCVVVFNVPTWQWKWFIIFISIRTGITVSCSSLPGTCLLCSIFGVVGASTSYITCYWHVLVVKPMNEKIEIIQRFESMNRIVSLIWFISELCFCVPISSRYQLAIAKESRHPLGMVTNMYPSYNILGQNKDEAITALPVDELIEKLMYFLVFFR